MGGVRVGGQTRVFSYEPDGSIPWRPDATRMLAAGVPVPTVSGRLGHANSSTTLNVYSHFLEVSDREAAEVLGKLLDGARTVRSS
jgi:integrase